MGEVSSHSAPGPYMLVRSPKVVAFKSSIVPALILWYYNANLPILSVRVALAITIWINLFQLSCHPQKNSGTHHGGRDLNPLEISKLAHSLVNSDRDSREQAEASLIECGTEALPVLEELMRATDVSRKVIVRGLIQRIQLNARLIRSHETSKHQKVLQQVETLIRALTVEPEATRQHLMLDLRKTLITSGDSRMLPVLLHGLKDCDSNVRLQAIHAIGALESEGALSALLHSLTHQDANVRYYAISGLRRYASNTDYDCLIRCSLQKLASRPEETDYDVRMNAAYCCVELGSEVDSGIFIDALRRDDVNHAIAVRALAKLSRKDAIGLIIGRLRVSPLDVDYWCGKALHDLTGYEYGTDWRKWAEWYENNKKSLPRQLE